MKKLLLLISIVLVAVLVAGCGQEVVHEEKSTTAPAEAPVQTRPAATAPQAPAAATAPETASTSDTGTSAIETEINSLDEIDSDLDLSQLDALDSDLAAIS